MYVLTCFACVGKIILLLFLFPGWVDASLCQPLSARSSATGGAGLFYADVWSQYNNPGALAQLEKFQAGIHVQNPYFVQQLSTRALAISIPVAKGENFAAGYSHFGYTLFAQQQASLAYARTIHRLALGFQFNYHRRQVYGEEPAQGVTVNAGTFFPLHKQILMGFSYNNILQQPLYHGYPKAQMRTGLAYRYATASMLLFEIEKQTKVPLLFKAGVEHALGDYFFFRGGYHLFTARYAFGVGFVYRFFRIDLAFVSHEHLGYSPFFSALYTTHN